MTGEAPICKKCKHFFLNMSGLKCKAFPKGIPKEMILYLNQ